MLRYDWMRVLAVLSTMFCLSAASRAQPTAPAHDTPQTAPPDPTVKRTYIAFSGGVFTPQALLYEPVSLSAKSHIAVVAMHSDLNYLNFSGCTELSRRGYRVLCVNRSGPPGGSLDMAIEDLRRAVLFLRSYPGVDTIVLLGHSGGASLMSAYQMIAQGGLPVCQGAEKIHKCPASLGGLPPADGVMLVDSNWGNAEMTLLSLDPAVLDPTSGMELDPDLDNFNPRNGFVAGGDSRYSTNFIHRFQQAQAERENSLTQAALGRLAAIKAHTGHFADDEPFVVPGGSQFQNSNRLFPQDTALMSHTAKPWALLHADGSATMQVVWSVRVPESNERSPTSSYERGAAATTVNNFLTNYAIRVSNSFGYDADTIHGIDWTSTYSSPPGNVRSIKVPLLVMGMTGHYEYLASETIYGNAASSDKTLVFVEGANHGYQTCKPCETRPGEFGDTQKTTFDFIDGWLAGPGRFGSR